MVSPTPKAIDSPAEPVVWTMLFWRMVVAAERLRNRVMARTATGIDAETVSPTLRTRYTDDAPKTMPSSAPMMTGAAVNSAGDSDAGTNGLWAGSGAVAMGCPGAGTGRGRAAGRR